MGSGLSNFIKLLTFHTSERRFPEIKKNDIFRASIYLGVECHFETVPDKVQKNSISHNL